MAKLSPIEEKEIRELKLALQKMKGTLRSIASNKMFGQANPTLKFAGWGFVIYFSSAYSRKLRKFYEDMLKARTPVRFQKDDEMMRNKITRTLKSSFGTYVSEVTEFLTSHMGMEMYLKGKWTELAKKARM